MLTETGEIIADGFVGDSGGFLNPAITFCFCLYRGLPWRRFPIYFLAQFLGGFVGAGVIYANYISAINNYEGHNIRTVPPSKTATGKDPNDVSTAGLTNDPSRWGILYVPSGILDKNKPVLLRIHNGYDPYVCYLCS